MIRNVSTDIAIDLEKVDAISRLSNEMTLLHIGNQVYPSTVSFELLKEMINEEKEKVEQTQDFDKFAG